ncbi:OLC1v1009290C1 [Oldenlandia corymbosa var. corymbosa]|uniref:OLC1v1009290C1 n=1 Tax=Oldenlandia corymbosa var. corymbosa TaxID=529605 RepID=A0AAV1DRW3_OLDCO|nr:OLC1v1009290C1 [Oldenlandia corymbosa var. corymbosa]
MTEMEEDNLPPPNSNLATAPKSHSEDEALQRKHSAMLERLSNLHQTRLAQKPNLELSTPSNESTQSFLNRFNESKLAVDSKLSGISQMIPDGDSSDPGSVKSELDSVVVLISNLEKLVAESSYFLPSYEVRTCLKTISDLKQQLDDVTSQVIPKKKFSFRNKKKGGPVSNPARSDVVDSVVVKPVIGIANVGLSGSLESSNGFRAKENEVLVREFQRDSGIGEFSISELNGCVVKLKGCLRALFVNKLRDCKVYVGPVLGSVLIEEVEGCVFVLASHQIRIHSAKRCDFYLRVRSRPIIEDCNEVRFAPYCLKYNGIEKDLETANLSEETGYWSNVDDFKWLRAVQSPNWTVLPEKERIEMVDISVFENVNVL